MTNFGSSSDTSFISVSQSENSCNQNQTRTLNPSESDGIGSNFIATNFGRSAATYQAQAHLQKQCAPRLLDLLEQSLRQQDYVLPPGPCLEIGCGTGFITELLCDRILHPQKFSPIWRDRTLHITDLSPEMVQFCQNKLQAKIHSSTSLRNQIRSSQTCFLFHTLDGEIKEDLSESYSLIIGGFVAQWFQNLEQSIKQLLEQLQPGGWLLLSFPGHESFPEWRQICNQLNLPFTAHPLPNSVHLLQYLSHFDHDYEVRLEIDWHPTFYSNPVEFFRSMKAIGAGISKSNLHLTPKQMRQLLQAWQPVINPSVDQFLPTQSFYLQHIQVQYQVVYLLIGKK